MDRHQIDLAGSAAPIVRTVCRRRPETSSAAIAISTAAEIAPGHSSYEEEAGTYYLDDDDDDDRGKKSRSHDEGPYRKNSLSFRFLTTRPSTPQ